MVYCLSSSQPLHLLVYVWPSLPMQAQRKQVLGGSCSMEHTPCYLRKQQAVMRLSSHNHSHPLAPSCRNQQLNPALFSCCFWPNPSCPFQLHCSGGDLHQGGSSEMTGPWDDQSLLFSCHATLTPCCQRMSLLVIPGEHNDPSSLDPLFYIS